ncbi:MAG: OmpH family outer membrane protein [Porphyromonas sp.]|nr:OmpH family outer membrane protein [Porphyromonas sp.]
MKNFNYISTAILAVAVVVLFGLHFYGNKGAKNGVQESGAGDSVAIQAETMPIAYINVDSILVHYQLSKELNEQMVRRAESAQATLNQRLKSFEAEAAEFQRKAQNQAFLSPQSAEQQRNNLMKRQAELEQLQQKLSVEIQQQQLETNTILRDTIMSQLAVFNKTLGVQVIFSNTMNDNILLSDKKYDITSKFLEYLNSNYTPSTTEKK